ncbi:MAG: hypothetical protein IH962_03080 [Chloroflexi bacterium]|nr:hypothetical protein [Chloroflexota bacterium]
MRKRASHQQNGGSPKSNDEPTDTQLCRREVERYTVHHLVPRSRGGRFGPTARLCPTCPRHIIFDTTVTPAEAGVQELALLKGSMDSGLRRNDECVTDTRQLYDKGASQRRIAATHHQGLGARREAVHTSGGSSFGPVTLPVASSKTSDRKGVAPNLSDRDRQHVHRAIEGCTRQVQAGSVKAATCRI